MCLCCHALAERHVPAASRRRFLTWAGAAAATTALPGHGIAQRRPPKPQNEVSPDEALKLLIQGNRRYVDGVTRRHDFRHERAALVKGQNPYAGILSCADSRIGPEFAFDSGRGDLFVCRVAGNFLNDDAIASFEYAVQVLKTPLLMVLGHKSCGAVDAVIKTIRDGSVLPGHLPLLVNAIGPAVKAVIDQPGDTLNNAIRQNVLLNVERLKTATPIIDKLVADKKVRVVGAVYNLDNGRVDILT